MSFLGSVKETIGLGGGVPRYRCDACGHVFESRTDPDSHWFGCLECDSTAVERLDDV